MHLKKKILFAILSLWIAVPGLHAADKAQPAKGKPSKLTAEEVSKRKMETRKQVAESLGKNVPVIDSKIN